MQKNIPPRIDSRFAPDSRFASLTRFASSNLRFARDEAIQIKSYYPGLLRRASSQ